jgi:hypothetical protein
VPWDVDRFDRAVPSLERDELPQHQFGHRIAVAAILAGYLELGGHLLKKLVYLEQQFRRGVRNPSWSAGIRASSTAAGSVFREFRDRLWNGFNRHNHTPT